MLAEGKDLPTPEALCSLKLPDWLKPNGHGICCLKMFPASYRMTMGRPLRPSSPHWMTWGIMSNGLCLTQNILEFPNQGKRRFSDIDALFRQEDACNEAAGKAA